MSAQAFPAVLIRKYPKLNSQPLESVITPANKATYGLLARDASTIALPMRDLVSPLPVACGEVLELAYTANLVAGHAYTFTLVPLTAGSAVASAYITIDGARVS